MFREEEERKEKSLLNSFPFNQAEGHGDHEGHEEHIDHERHHQTDVGVETSPLRQDLS